MTILALDLSLSRTGVAIDCNPIRAYDIPSGKLRGVERLCYIRDRVITYFHEYEVSLVVIEDYSMGSHGRNFHIGELGGVVKSSIYDRGVPILLVSPKELKKFATGKGNADKEEVSTVVTHEWGVAVTNLDQSDAVALCMIGKAYIGTYRARKSYRVEVIKRLRATPIP